MLICCLHACPSESTRPFGICQAWFPDRVPRTVSHASRAYRRSETASTLRPTPPCAILRASPQSQPFQFHPAGGSPRHGPQDRWLSSRPSRSPPPALQCQPPLFPALPASIASLGALFAGRSGRPRARLPWQSARAQQSRPSLQAAPRPVICGQWACAGASEWSVEAHRRTICAARAAFWPARALARSAPDPSGRIARAPVCLHPWLSFASPSVPSSA